MNKNILLIISSILFSLLFYQQNIGLNFLLFSLLAIALHFIFNPRKFKILKVLTATITFLITSTLVFLYNSSLSIVSTVVAFFYFLGTLSEDKSSVYIQLLNGLFSSIASGFSLYYNRFLAETKEVKKKNIDYIYWLKMVGIPTIVLLVFVILYRSANPYFDELLNRIDFSFVNFQWILFTVLGYFLLLNITSPITVISATSFDLKTNNNLSEDNIKPQSNENLSQENQLGIILLVLLNMLILFFLITDTFFLWHLTDLNASGLSNAVHEGVYALITSIVFAIAIILYFFRGNLNFYKKNKNLKTLTTLWIALNIILILYTGYKNQLYVSFHGLTYKRIGVFVYLVLSIIGLTTTFIKVYATLNFWFLCRKNISIGFVILLIATTINWDKQITIYNTKHAENIDFEYLIGLSDNNTFQLKQYVDMSTNELPTSTKARIIWKYNQYYTNLENNNWQELVFDNLILKQ